MCNAWNHPKGCSCGWGGTGYNKNPVNCFQIQWEFIPPINASNESYVIPNASCPVCGEGVFFYSNTSGSRVFFDELGPPWPKHPCTDSKSTPLALDQNKQTQRKFTWQENGFKPFFITSATSYDHASIRISGHAAGKSIFFYIEKKPIEYSIEHLNSGNVVALIDNENNPKKMHFLSLAGNPIKAETHQFSTEIHKPKNNTAAAPAQMKKPPTNSIPKTALTQPKKKPKSSAPKETSLLLALKKALKGKARP